MPEPSFALLEHRLDAWGRAELHSASKQLAEPGPAFTNAVAAEAKHQRMIVGGILLALLVVLLSLLAIAYIRAQPFPGASDDGARSPSRSHSFESLPLVR